MGAPQKHGQRSYKKSIAEFDSDYASADAVLDKAIVIRGLEAGAIQKIIKYAPQKEKFKQYKDYVGFWQD